MAQNDGQGTFSFPQPGMQIRPANRTAGDFDQKAVLICGWQRIFHYFKVFIGRRHHGRLAGFRHDFFPSDTKNHC
jgi:hypothetical protein